MKIEDVYKVRQENLLSIVQERFSGRQNFLASAANVGKSRVSRWVTGSMNMGEKVARNLEEKLGLPSYWLDTKKENMEVQP